MNMREYAHGDIIYGMLLNNALICLKMPETKPRISKQYLQIYLGAFRMLSHV